MRLHNSRHVIKGMTLRGDLHDYLAAWNSIPARRAVNSVKRAAVAVPSTYTRDSAKTAVTLLVSGDVEMTNL